MKFKLLPICMGFALALGSLRAAATQASFICDHFLLMTLQDGTASLWEKLSVTDRLPLPSAVAELLDIGLDKLSATGTTFETELSQDGGPSSFSLRIIPDEKTPLGRLATQMKLRSFDVYLSSCASTGTCETLDYSQIYEIRLPVEAADIGFEDVPVIIHAIEQIFDDQEYRLLLYAVNSPATTARIAADISGDKDIRYCPAQITQSHRQAMRQHRRFYESEPSPQKNTEMALLHLLGKGLVDLKAKPDHEEMHRAFAETLQIYLEHTGLVTEIKKSEGVFFDVLIKAVSPEDWRKRYEVQPTSPKFLPILFPEWHVMANQFKNQNRALGWSNAGLVGPLPNYVA